MAKRLKFVVEQWVLYMVRRQTWQAWRFEIFEPARHFRIESNRDVIESGHPIRIRIESNLEASQVPNSQRCQYHLCFIQSQFTPIKLMNHLQIRTLENKWANRQSKYT